MVYVIYDDGNGMKAERVVSMSVGLGKDDKPKFVMEFGNVVEANSVIKAFSEDNFILMINETCQRERTEALHNITERALGIAHDNGDIPDDEYTEIVVMMEALKELASHLDGDDLDIDANPAMN